MALDIPDNVLAFNFWTLWTMAQLWDSFPAPQSFNPQRDVMAYKANLGRDGHKIGADEVPSSELLGPTIDWLLSEGFIRGKRGPAGIYEAVTLTTRGFSVLNLVPKSITQKPEDKPLGTLMREAVVQKGVDLAATLVRTMLLGHEVAKP
jgi:hypothetical protein